jgi:hypothetical protein
LAGGTIHRWQGCIDVRGTSVSRVVDTLVTTGTPPPQPDVLDARLLDRHGDTLRVQMTLVRSAIVTVYYDTEHEMTFHRLGPSAARARSVATRIEQRGGRDDGFLWRLQSYWTYTQRGPDVRITLTSYSLSRERLYEPRHVAAQ